MSSCLRGSPFLSVSSVARLSEDRPVTSLVQGTPRYLVLLDAVVNEIVLHSSLYDGSLGGRRNAIDLCIWILFLASS